MANGEEQHDGSMTACGHHAAFPDVSPVAPPPPSLVPLSPSSRDPGQVTASPEKHPQAQTPQAALPGAPQQQTSPGYTCRIEMADGHGTVVHSQEFGDAGQVTCSLPYALGSDYSITRSCFDACQSSLIMTDGVFCSLMWRLMISDSVP